MVRSIWDVLYLVPVILLSISVHELCHGIVSDRLGDPTPRQFRRLTLNPLRHLDPLGTLMFFVVGVGWAKPVPISPAYYKDRRLGTLVVSLAGPFSNLGLAFVAGLLFAILRGMAVSQSGLSGILLVFLITLYTVNISFAAFNILPIPPLDGSRILSAVLPEKLYLQMRHYEQYIGLLFLMIALLRPGIIVAVIRPLYWFFDKALSTMTGWITGLIF